VPTDAEALPQCAGQEKDRRKRRQLLFGQPSTRAQHCTAGRPSTISEEPAGSDEDSSETAGALSGFTGAAESGATQPPWVAL
jgi:hypothetical protein